MGILFFIGILAVATIYLAMLYNNLVNLKHNVSKAWANINVLLKQRHDELPKLVETCKQYMQFEQSTLEKVIKARTMVSQASQQHDLDALGTAETSLRAGLGKLFALAENYPELKANDNFQHLQGRISGLENAIADRREFYNEAVNLNNVRREQFPDILVARAFGFAPAEFLRVSVGEKTDLDLKRLFS